MRGDDPSAGRGIADNVSADVLGEMQRLGHCICIYTQGWWLV